MNIAPIMAGDDAETLVRLLMTGVKRLDVARDSLSARFISRVFLSISRIPHYVSLMVDEGYLPVILAMLEFIPDNNVVDDCSEILFNLSMLRKNRRDMSTSGISSQINKLFDATNTLSRAYALLLVGNMLGSGLFIDKILRAEVLARVLELMDPSDPPQVIK